MKFKISQLEDGTYYEEFTFWQNATLRALIEYQKALDLGVIDEPRSEHEFCALIRKISGNIKIVSDLPFAEYELDQFEESPISLEEIRLVLNQPLSKLIHIPKTLSI